MPQPARPSHPIGVATSQPLATLAARWAVEVATRLPHYGRGWALRLALATLYLCGWSALSVIRLQPTDLERFYIPAALVALRGNPLLIYSASHQHGYPLANGPLSIAPLVVALALVTWLGWLRSAALIRLVVVMIYSVFSLLLAREAVHLIDRHAPTPLRGARRLLVYEVFLVSLQLWQSMLYYGHVEQPLMLWLALAGVRAVGKGRARRAGALLGLALLTRTTALTIIIPVALLLLSQCDWRSLRRFCVTLGAVTAIGILPFALADGPDLLYSLVSFHNTEPLTGGNVWQFFTGTALMSLAQRADGVIVLAATCLVAGLVLWARPDLRADSRDFAGLLALCSLCHPAFVNALWPYYFLEAYTFCALWWLAQGRGLADRRARTRWLLWGAAPVGVTLLGQARQFTLAQQLAALPYSAPAATVWSLLTACALLLLMAALAWRLIRQPTQDMRAAQAK